MDVLGIGRSGRQRAWRVMRWLLVGDGVVILAEKVGLKGFTSFADWQGSGLQEPTPEKVLTSTPYLPYLSREESPSDSDDPFG